VLHFSALSVNSPPLSRPLTIFSMLLRSLLIGGGDLFGEEVLLFSGLPPDGASGVGLLGGEPATTLGVIGVGVTMAGLVADDSVDVGLGEWRGLCREPGVTVSKAEPRGEFPSRVVLGVVALGALVGTPYGAKRCAALRRSESKGPAPVGEVEEERADPRPG
jgi:hypothetical protein